jgi:hypothetical protein
MQNKFGVVWECSLNAIVEYSDGSEMLRELERGISRMFERFEGFTSCEEF